MKVICNRGALLEALTVAGNVVASRTPKPVLQCVKLTAAEDRLTVAATDLEVAIRYSDTQVQIEEPGETWFPPINCATLSESASMTRWRSKSPETTPTFAARIRTSKSLRRKPPIFLPFPISTEKPISNSAAGQLKQLIGQTLFAAARESTRYAFNGVLLSAKAQKDQPGQHRWPPTGDGQRGSGFRQAAQGRRQGNHSRQGADAHG